MSLGIDGVLGDVDGALAHRDDAPRAAGLVGEDADRVAAGVGDEDVAVGIVDLHIAGRGAQGGGAQQRRVVVVEDADRVTAQIGDGDAGGCLVHEQGRGLPAHEDRT
jgi:hypothetical protein